MNEIVLLICFVSLTMVGKRKFKPFLFLLPIFSIIYLINIYAVTIQSNYLKNYFLIDNEKLKVISRQCICNSTDKDIQIAFSQGGNQMYDFSCPMTVNVIGRLGNVMGQYATLLALSQMNGHVPYQQESMKNELSKYFYPSIPVISTQMYEKVKWVHHGIHDWMSDEYSNFDCNFTVIRGYPSSWTFFHHIKHVIKREFQFRDDIVNDVQTHLASLRKSKTTTFIGIHVRRDDYEYLIKNSYDGVLATSEFFIQAMNYFRNKFKDCLFVVCSDDLNWCKQNIKNDLNDVHFCWNRYLSSSGRDMALLTHCNHSTITIGTFSFWTAYLTGGEVVYLNNYLRNGSKFGEVFRFDAAYLPQWLPIDADLNSAQ